jgi:uncharacterized membrane protein YdjX (TVP38/TMEM64 family)
MLEAISGPDWAHTSLAWAQMLHADLQQAYAQRPLQVAVLWCAALVGLSALCLPGAGVLLLLGGALFGLGWGTLLGTLASTGGAVLTMLAVRHALRDRVARRFGPQVQALDLALAARGAAYVLSLRLLPVIPYVAVNLMSGLTRLPTRTFAWASALGMAPGTAVYVNAGMQLGQLQTLHGLGSPTVLLSLAALAALPLAVHWLKPRGAPT